METKIKKVRGFVTTDGKILGSQQSAEIHQESIDNKEIVETLLKEIRVLICKVFNIPVDIASAKAIYAECFSEDEDDEEDDILYDIQTNAIEDIMIEFGLEGMNAEDFEEMIVRMFVNHEKNIFALFEECKKCLNLK